MDDFERQEILEEFLVKWNGGASATTIAKDLVARGRNPSDVADCRRIFAKWLESKKPWDHVKRIRA
jgi:hypothetical protein